MKLMRIATWNVGSVHEDKRSEDLFLSIIKQIEADIFCLQELPEDPALFERILASGKFKDYCFKLCSKSHVGLQLNMGIAIFSKECISNSVDYKLVKPYETLTEYYGNVETLHDKYFLAVEIGDTVIVSGHSFPSVRYCSPKYQYRPEMKKEWQKYCVSQEDYADTLIDIQKWLLELSASFKKPVIAAADFNVDDPLGQMPTLKKTYYDVFSGEKTRPSKQNYGFEYKSDGILVPQGMVAIKKQILKNDFDHYALYADLSIMER